MSVPVRLRFRPVPAPVPGLSLLLLGLLAAGCRQAPAQPDPRPVLRVASAFAPFSVRLTEEYKRTLWLLNNTILLPSQFGASGYNGAQSFATARHAVMNYYGG